MSGGSLGEFSGGEDEGIKPNLRSSGYNLIGFLGQNPTAPVSLVFSMGVFIKSKFKFIDRKKTYFRAIMDEYLYDLNIRSCQEFGQWYSTLPIERLTFNAGLRSCTNYYYTLSESVYILDRLLTFQYFDNSLEIKRFLSRLYCIVDRIIPKKNCMFILSAPNAGKNFFFDAVIHYFLNFGQLGNFNKFNSFPMQDCVNRRILLWNEPVLEPSAEETLKCLFGGDTINVKVKYLDDAIVNRTPVIELSNNNVFPKNEAFKSRMFFEQWRPCPELRELQKKPIPYAIYHLFLKYNIFVNYMEYIK